VGGDDGGAASENGAQGGAQRWGDVDVEGGERFVEQEEGRIGGQRTGDGDALRLPARELVGATAGVVGEVDPAQPLAGHRVRPVAGDAAAAGTEGHVVEGGHVGEEQGVLGEETDVAPVRWHERAAPPRGGLGQGAAGQGDPGVPGVEEARRGSEQGGLPGTVRAEEGERAALLDLEVDGEVAFGDGGVEGEAHRVLLPNRENPITSTATSTSTRERATAASASDSRWR